MEEEFVCPVDALALANCISGEDKHNKELEQSTRFNPTLSTRINHV